MYTLWTHTHKVTFFYRKNTFRIHPLSFLKTYSFSHFLYTPFFLFSIYFYNIMPHLVTTRRRRRKIKSPTKRIGRGCTFYILKCSFFNLLLWTFLSINNNNISRRCDINEKKDFLSFMRHFFPRWLTKIFVSLYHQHQQHHQRQQQQQQQQQEREDTSLCIYQSMNLMLF